MTSLFATGRHRVKRARRQRPAAAAPARFVRPLGIEPLEGRRLLAADLVLTELMASNSSSLEDRTGQTHDWIEIHNPGSEPIDLSGWTLTDDAAELDKWALPPVPLDADSYLVVFASGEDRVEDGYRLLRDLVSTGDSTLLVDLPDGTYDVRVVLGDATRPRDEVVVRVQGEAVETVATGLGEFFSGTYQAVVSGDTNGQLAIRFEDVGGATGRASVNGIVVTPQAGGGAMRFDFGTADSPLEPGYLRVTASDTYDPKTGYGWESGTVRNDKDRDLDWDEPHANFKLSSDGEYLGLVAPDGTIVSQFGGAAAGYPAQVTDVSYGRTPDGPRYFTTPTPRAPNGTTGLLGLIPEPAFTVGRGFYDEPFLLEIASGEPGTVIRYTTDGTPPSETNGTVYTGPITVDGTTTLRARATKADYLPSSVETQTYLFLADVLLQSPGGEAPAGWPTGPVRGQALDYGMDPEIVNDPVWGPLLIGGLRQIPSLSIVTDLDNLVDPATGIYVNARQDGRSWERPTSVELLTPDGGDSFQVDAGLRIRGGFSRGGFNPKHSFRLFFRSAYGDAKLSFPLFGAEGVDQFQAVDLRTAQNYAWSNDTFNDQRRNTFLRDIYSRDLQREQGSPYTRGRYYQLYINGQYWGLYQTEERPEASYAAAYFGGDEEDYDVIKASGTRLEATDGVIDKWNELWAIARAGFQSTDDYFALQGKNADGSDNPELEVQVDIDNLIDFMLNVFFTGNDDMPTSLGAGEFANNFWAIRDRTGRDGWRFIAHDNEHNMLSKLADETGDDPAGNQVSSFNPKYLHQQLDELLEYRVRFADRTHKLFFNGGPMTTDRAVELLQGRARQIDRAIIAESARWGDQHNQPPLTRDTWAAEVDWLVNTFLAQRREIVLDQLRGRRLYPSIAAPEFGQHGGEVAAGFPLSIRNPEEAGTVYVTTDGSDPRALGGGIGGSAVAVTGPVTLGVSGVVKARLLLDGQWSALNEAEFTVVDSLPLRISEINYHPHDALPRFGEPDVDDDRFEFVELVNTGREPIDLDGVRFVEVAAAGDTAGIQFEFGPRSLAGGETVLVVRDVAAFTSRYGSGHAVAGEYSGKLSNRGEQLTLVDARGRELQSVRYDDSADWPAAADGAGATLERIDLDADANDPDNWRSSSRFGGSPGLVAPDPAADVVINEVLSRGAADQPDRIELHNVASRPVDVGGWYLSDSGNNLFKYRFPAATSIDPGGFLAIDQSLFGFEINGMSQDDVWLVAADPASGKPLRLANRVVFGASAEGVAWGRWPDGNGLLFPQAGQTFGSANAGPQGSAVIVSEVHYHPAEPAVLRQDFDDGATDGLAPDLGDWSIAAGRYVGGPGEDEVAIALVELPEGYSKATEGRNQNGVMTMRPAHADVTAQGSKVFRISATVNPRKQDGLKTNGMIVFDYHGPTDFKYASIHARAGRWRIGQRDADGWRTLAELPLPVAADTDHELTVEIRDSVVSLWGNGAPKMIFDFGTPLGDGQVGVGARDAVVEVDNVVVEAAGTDADFEFIELLNATSVPIDLANWRLAGAVTMTVAPGTTIDPGATLVLVGFDPADTDRAAAFRCAFGIDDRVPLAGPYTGRLSNGGETLELLRPTAATPSVWTLGDRVPYDDQAPWPAAADGAGRSLQRRTADAFGDDPASWLALAPTPGTVRFAAAGDMNLDGVVDKNDIEALVLSLTDRDAYEEIYGVPAALGGDLDGDGDSDFDDIAGFLAALRQ